MAEAIGIRLEVDFLKKVERLCKKEVEDRSSTLRKLLEKGYRQKIKENATETYKKGLITISKAAQEAEITVWEMQEHLINQGVVSSYNKEDLKREKEILDKIAK